MTDKLTELQARYAAACDLKQNIDRDKISAAMADWARQIGAPAETRVMFVSSVDEMLSVANAASVVSVARAAWHARPARPASVANAANVARDARAARAASAARATRDAWDARAARAASAAWVARAAWDATWLAITAIGAVSLNDDKTARIWLPILDAFEAGAFAFWVTDSDIFIATLPSVVKVDSERRLHAEAGPAFKWVDGIEEHYWHGALVPAEWINDRKSVSVSDVLSQKNAETRRAGCEIIGWDRVLSGIDAKEIDADGDPQIGTLYEGQIPGATKCTFLKAQCGTGREFVIPTPPGLKTAIEAQAWIYAVPVKEWVRPEVRG